MSSLYNIIHSDQDLPIEAYFYRTHGIMPSITYIRTKNNLNNCHFNFKILDIFNDVTKYEYINRTLRIYNCTKLYRKKETNIYYQLTYSLEYVSMSIYSTVPELENVDTIIKELISNKKYEYKLKKEKDITNLFCIIKAYSGGFTTIQNSKKVKAIDINLNYNDDFIDEYKSIVKNLTSTDVNNKGLVLFHGDPGTGKTRLIKQLSKDVNKKFIIVPPTFIPNISTPEFLSFMLMYPNSVLVLEDSEDYMIERTSTGNGQSSAVSAILNITDGIYSDFLDIKIIATFNSDFNKLDKALTRKGRILSRYEFKKLTVEKSNKLFKHLELDMTTDVEMSLADIYNIKDKNYNSKSTAKRVGF